MNILVACEESQVVCKAFRNKGHNAFSCDTEKCSGGCPQWHIRQDVLPLLDGNCTFTTEDGTEHRQVGRWDMIIGFPPCTYMSKAGARWMYPQKGVVSPERLEKALKAKEFFMAIKNADCDKIVIENPRPLRVVGLPTPTQTIQPYQFGHPYSKLTCLWLKGVPQLEPTEIIKDYKPYCPSNTGGVSRGQSHNSGGAVRKEDAKTRSKTFPGVGAAMAEQWG